MHEKLKIVFFLCWLVLVGSVSWAIIYQEEFFRNESESIAEIQSRSGDVMYREEGLISWRYVVDNQKFADGDWVATGPGAQSAIGFRSGQNIKLGPDTQVQIRSILQGNNDYSYMVTLSRGAVVAEVKKDQISRHRVPSKQKFLGLFDGDKNDDAVGKDIKKETTGMVVRSGNRSFAVESGGSVGLMKDSDKGVVERIGNADKLNYRFKHVKINSVEGIKPNFLPPSARLFPEKIGSVVIAKEAVLPSSVAGSAGGSRRISEGSAGSDSETGEIPNEESDVKEASRAMSSTDLAALSAGLFSPGPTGNIGVSSEQSSPPSDKKSVGLKLRGLKNSGNLPVLALKEKVDRMDIGLLKELAALKSEPLDVGTKKSKKSQKNGLKSSERRIPIRRKTLVKQEKESQEGKSDTKVTNAKGYEYFLAIPDRSLSLSFFRNASSLRNDRVKVALSAPIKMPQVGDLRPVIELVGKNGSKIPLIEGRSVSEKEIEIPLDLLISHGRERINGPFKEYEVSARAGCIWRLNGKRMESFEQAFSQIKFRALSDSVSEGLTVGLDLLDWDLAAESAASSKTEIAPESAPVRISIQSQKDFSKIHPFINAASRVGLVKGGPREDFGYFIVRKQAVVAEVGGAGLTKKILQKITLALGGDFVFRGQKSALHDSRDKSQKDIAVWIDSLLDQGKVLYVMKRSKLYPVSRDFVKTNNEVAKFIDSQAKAVFVEKVDVLFFR